MTTMILPLVYLRMCSMDTPINSVCILNIFQICTMPVQHGFAASEVFYQNDYDTAVKYTHTKIKCLLVLLQQV